MASLDGLTILDWLLRLSNLLGLLVLFGVARKIGRFEERQEQQTAGQGGVSKTVTELSNEIKALSRVVYEILGTLRGGGVGKGGGRFPL